MPISDTNDIFDLNYFDVMKLEGIDVNTALKSHAPYANVNEQPSDTLKVPAISHDIWLTNPEKPNEIRSQDWSIFKEKIALMDSGSEKWTHILWTNCKACIPKTVEKMNSIGVEVREIDSIKDQLAIYPHVLSQVEQKQFGIAGDGLRFELLKVFGGFYSDLNYILAQSPEKAMKTWDWFAHSDRGGIFADVFMIASAPQHPIMIDAAGTTLRNFEQPPLYIQQAQNASVEITYYTGLMTYMPFNCAIFKHLGESGSNFVYPLSTQDPYPENAKQPEFTFVEENEGWLDYLKRGTSQNMEYAKQEWELTNDLQEYSKNEICMQQILGFDALDGDSWIRVP